MEKRTELKVYRIDKQCPKCSDGIMESVAAHAAHPMDPYDHRCIKCGYPEKYHQVYPKVEYEDITDE